MYHKFGQEFLGFPGYHPRLYRTAPGILLQFQLKAMPFLENLHLQDLLCIPNKPE
jgi:hypothetical protein